MPQSCCIITGMKMLILPIVLALLVAPGAYALQAPFPRLSPDVFDVVPPSALVRGAPGSMTVQRSGCRTLPTAETRRRIVDVAVQEWAFFGFSLIEPDVDEGDDDGGFRPDAFRRRDIQGAAHAASSIAGYWAVTPQGAGIISNQNRAWNGGGIGERWVAPWSAAFISWLTCESGLGAGNQFQRAIAHHVYIDQAIRARDGSAPQAAFTAHDIGEAAIEPGDLLCSSRRPVYRNLAERRRQMGEGARTHCDVVVKVDEPGRRIFAIGGNVRGSVSMKLLPAVQAQGKLLRPTDQPILGRRRPVFAHLKLRARPVEANALDNSPTIRALACRTGAQESARIRVLTSAAVGTQRC